MKDLKTMQREGREKVYKDIIYWVMNPSAREAIFTPKEADDVIDQHTANTWKAAQESMKKSILESGLLEEVRTGTTMEWEGKASPITEDGADGHNQAVEAVKEFISNMDTNSVDSIHLNKQAN